MESKAFLKILSVPPGDAPEWVRAQWVGLELPLAGGIASAHTVSTLGVLSVPKTWLGWHLMKLFRRFKTEKGYVVECTQAVEVLEAAHPEAAAWWRENTPELIRPSQCFMFHQHVGQVVTSRANPAD